MTMGQAIIMAAGLGSRLGELTVAVPKALIEVIAGRYADLEQDRIDGLTVDAGDWWCNVRASNTEPLLRLNLEAATRGECDAHVAEVLSIITRT